MSTSSSRGAEEEQGCGGEDEASVGEHLSLQELILRSPPPDCIHTPRSLSFRGKEIHQRDRPLLLSHPLLFCSVSNKFRFLPFLLTQQILLPFALPAPLPHSRAFWWHMRAISLLSLPFLIHLPTQSTKPLCAPPPFLGLQGTALIQPP